MIAWERAVNEGLSLQAALGLTACGGAPECPVSTRRFLGEARALQGQRTLP